MKRFTRVLLVALLILGAGALPAQAVSLSGRSSTQALWFADEFDQDHFSLAQYIRFNAREIDRANTVQVSGYGRASGDFQAGGGVDGRLYYLYLDKKGMPGMTDVRVGRQFFFVSAGSMIVDGVRIDSRPFGPIAVTAAGGRHVKFDVTGEDTKRGDLAGAVQVSLAGVKDTSADLSYLVKYDESDRVQEILGLAASRRFGKIGELYSQFRFDILSEVWSEIQVGARTSILPKWTFNAEYFRSIPVFDASSIFVVFAVERFQEALFRAQYDFSKKVTLSGEYRNESFGGGDTANVGELGVRFRPSDGTSLYAAGIWRVGTGGNLVGFELSGDKVILQKYILAAGVQHDSFRRELTVEYDSATRFWLGAEAKLRKNLSAQARVEDTISDRFDKDIRARLALNLDF